MRRRPGETGARRVNSYGGVLSVSTEQLSTDGAAPALRADDNRSYRVRSAETGGWRRYKGGRLLPMKENLKRWIERRRDEAQEHEEKAEQIELLLKAGVSQRELWLAEQELHRQIAKSLWKLADEIETRQDER